MKYEIERALHLCLKRIGFAMNMRGVELDTVIHISIQFWKEPWPFGMENEKTEIRSIKQRNQRKIESIINPLDTGLKCFISIILLGLALAEFWS